MTGTRQVNTPAEPPARATNRDEPQARERSWRRRVLVAMVFVVAAIVMLRRTPAELANRLPGNLGDAVLVIWMLRWGGHALVHSPAHAFNANIFWPYPHTFAYADPLLSVAPVYGAFFALSGNWILSWNLLWLGLIGLNLGATYSLTRWLIGRTDAAIFAALAVGFSAYVLQNAGHPQLQLIGFVPLGFLLFFKLLERPRMSTAVMLGTVNVAIALGALYIATGYALAAVVILAGFTIAVKGRVGWRLLGYLAVAGLITLVAAPVTIPYRAVEHTFGARPLAPEWGLRPRDIVRPSAGSYLYRSLSADTDPGSGERHAFPGFITMALAIIGLGALIFDRRRRRDAHRLEPGPDPGDGRRLFLVLLVVTGAVLGVLAIGALGNGGPTPWRLIYDHVPPLSGVRVPARLVAFSLLAGGVLAAAGLTAILRRLPRPALRVALTAGCCVVVLAELAAPVFYTHIPSDPASLAVYDALSHRPPGAVAELPIYDPGVDIHDWAYGEPTRMVWSTIDFHPRINGYSGYVSPTYYADTATVATFPSAEAVAFLKARHVRYLILHLGVQTSIQMYSEDQANAMIAKLPPQASAIRYGSNYLVDISAV